MKIECVDPMDTVLTVETEGLEDPKKILEPVIAMLDAIANNNVHWDVDTEWEVTIWMKDENGDKSLDDLVYLVGPKKRAKRVE